MSVPCSHLLIGQSNVVVDFHPGNVELHCVSAIVLTSRKNAWEKNFHLSSTLLRKLCVHYANGFGATLH
jgi:hypothetical protein